MWKLSLLLVSMFLVNAYASAQDCSVEANSLKGTYSGGCKNGKANGKGKAVGVDSYEGNFSAGLPNGQGTYHWSNGNEFTGWFVKGQKDGLGKLIYKRPEQRDSILEGVWKKDVYIGPPKESYRVVYQSKGITEIDVEKKTDGINSVTFFISTTSGTARNLEGDEFPKLKVDEVQALSGTIGRLYYNNESTGKRTESVIENVQFPARLKATIGTEEIEIEFMQPGHFVVSIRINN